METDEEIQRIIYSEICNSYFGIGLHLLSILDLEWRKLDPLTDIAPDNLKYGDDSSHIYFMFRALVYCDDSQNTLDSCNLAIDTNAYLYSEQQFNYAGQGPFACPTDSIDLDWENIDITKKISDEIAHALIDDDFDIKEKLIAYNGEEAFLKKIKHKKLKQAMTKSWKKNKDSWV